MCDVIILLQFNKVLWQSDCACISFYNYNIYQENKSADLGPPRQEWLRLRAKVRQPQSIKLCKGAGFTVCLET